MRPNLQLGSISLCLVLRLFRLLFNQIWLFQGLSNSICSQLLYRIKAPYISGLDSRGQLWRSANIRWPVKETGLAWITNPDKQFTGEEKRIQSAQGVQWEPLAALKMGRRRRPHLHTEQTTPPFLCAEIWMWCWQWWQWKREMGAQNSTW